MRSTKFGAKKVVDKDGQKFDSKLEMNRWNYLKAAQEGGLIFGLQRQVKFVLIPAQYEVTYPVNKRTGKLMKPKKKLIERECSYFADFAYEVVDQFKVLPEPKFVIEDTKGFKTKEYIIKRKLMTYNGNRVREVKRYNEPIC